MSGIYVTELDTADTRLQRHLRTRLQYSPNVKIGFSVSSLG